MLVSLVVFSCLRAKGSMRNMSPPPAWAASLAGPAKSGIVSLVGTTSIDARRCSGPKLDKLNAVLETCKAGSGLGFDCISVSSTSSWPLRRSRFLGARSGIVAQISGRVIAHMGSSESRGCAGHWRWNGTRCDADNFKGCQVKACDLVAWADSVMVAAMGRGQAAA